MRKTTFVLAFTTMMATTVAAFGQSIPANTTFFDFDFGTCDNIIAQFGNNFVFDAAGAQVLDAMGNPVTADDGSRGGDASGQPNDNGGIFTGGFDNRGPFVDGPLATQIGFNNSPMNQNMNVDTTAGFAQETPTSPTNYPTGNIFLGQPRVMVGDTVRLISELSFTKNLAVDPVTGAMVETNSQFDNFFFGFRGGIGTNEFAPNDGVAQSFRYNLGMDNTVDTDSNISAFANTNATTNFNVNAALAPVTSLGIDIANGDFETDVFRIVTDAVVTASSPAVGITFDVTTSIEDMAGTVLGTTAMATTTVDTGINLAGDRIAFAIRDAN